MGSKFEIRDSAVQKHGSNLETSVAALNGDLRKFISALEGLPGVWKGAAFQSFQQLQQRWEQASKDLNQALRDIQGRVGSAAATYDAGHQEQQQQISKTTASANWDAAKFRG